MIITQEQKSKLEKKLNEYWWGLPKELFGGDAGVDMHDFELYNYRFFLDDVKSVNQLLEGLQHLSPLADDALVVVEKMKEQDFLIFREALQYERKMKDSKLPNEYTPLVIPQRFIQAGLLSEKFGVSLGTALIRIMESEINGGCIK